MPQLQVKRIQLDAADSGVQLGLVWLQQMAGQPDSTSAVMKHTQPCIPSSHGKHHVARGAAQHNSLTFCFFVVSCRLSTSLRRTRVPPQRGQLIFHLVNVHAHGIHPLSHDLQVRSAYSGKTEQGGAQFAR